MELTRYAREVGTHPRTLRRRVRELHDRHGGILRSYTRPGQRVGKWWVNPVALQAAMVRTDTEDRLDDHEHRVVELEHKATALRDAFNSLRGMLKRHRVAQHA
ncbi:nirD-like proteiN [Caudoviricetes sp.]|nr:nirD-like proteiN [Caudoviricetes sp.]